MRGAWGPAGLNATRTARRRSRSGGLAASSVEGFVLAGGPFECAAALACAIVVILVFVVGLAVGAPVEVTPLALLAVLFAAIALSSRLASGVLLLAIGLLVIQAATGRVPPGTVALEAGVFASLGGFAHLYAARFARLVAGSDRDTPPGKNWLELSPASIAFGLGNLVHLVDASNEGIVAVDEHGRIRYANPAAGDLLGLTEGSEARPLLFELVASDDRSRVQSELSTAARNQAGRVTFHVRNADGAERELEVSHTLMAVRARPVRALGIRDITEVSRLQQATTALAETAASLAVTQPLEETLAAVARRVVEVTGACACGVFLMSGERSWRLAGSWGLPAGYEAAVNRAAQAGVELPVFGAVRTRAPVFVEDLPQRIRAEAQLVSVRPFVQEVPWQGAVAIPMIHAERPLGGLTVYFPPGPWPDAPTMDFLSATAGQAASAAEIFRLVAVAQGQVAVEERHRLSRELHDSLSQAIYGIILGAKSARKRLTGDPERVAEPLDYILDLAEGALADMRGLVLELRPESLERDGLMAALGQHARALNARQGLQVITQLDGEFPDSLDTKLCAYRIVQEALHNVVKHAHAEHAWLRAEIADGVLAIEVSDDGEGFYPDASFSGHFGLESMKERVAALGGEMTISSTPGRGTTLRARLPIHSDAHEGQPPPVGVR